MKNFFLVASLTIGLYSGVAFSQTTPVVGLPVALGDSIEKVRTSLQTSLEPVESTSAGQKNTKALRLKTKGIWVFFDKSNQVYNVRLEAPFQGNVGGVKIGDSLALLEKTLGKPAKTLKSRISMSDQFDPYIYYIDDLTTVRFDFDRDGLIETIFVLK